MNHKDFFGKEIQIGDIVAFIELRYRGLIFGQVTAFTPKMVRVNYFKSALSRLEPTLLESRNIVVAPPGVSPKWAAEFQKKP